MTAPRWAGWRRAPGQPPFGGRGRRCLRAAGEQQPLKYTHTRCINCFDPGAAWSLVTIIGFTLQSPHMAARSLPLAQHTGRSWPHHNLWPSVRVAPCQAATHRAQCTAPLAPGRTPPTAAARQGTYVVRPPTTTGAVSKTCGLKRGRHERYADRFLLPAGEGGDSHTSLAHPHHHTPHTPCMEHAWNMHGTTATCIMYVYAYCRGRP
jgi:hypothetical protein